MSYRVISRFADLTDGKFLYNAGDVFPREGFSVSQKRLDELAGSDNRACRPLIERIPDPEKQRERVRKRA